MPFFPELPTLPPFGDPGAPEAGAGDVGEGADAAGDAEAATDPLVLDLTGAGLNLTALNARSPYFDWAGDGFARKTGWVGAGTGLLALDADGDGEITGLPELFGTAGGHADGFAALRALDGNGDGKIDAADAAYARLRVWTDANQNAATDRGELHGLAELGIAAIGLAAQVTGRTVAGNRVTATGSYTLADGTTREIADVEFANTTTYTRATASVAVPAEVAALPELHGYGTLPGLRQAMAGNPALESLVRDFAAGAATMSLADVKAATQAIMLEWAGVSGVDPLARGGWFDARKLGFIEGYLGRPLTFVGNVGGDARNPWMGPRTMLERAWTEFQDGITARLLVQAAPDSLKGAFRYDQALDAVLPIKDLKTASEEVGQKIGPLTARTLDAWREVAVVLEAHRADMRYDKGAFVEAISRALPGSAGALVAASIEDLRFDLYSDTSSGLGGSRAAEVFAGLKGDGFVWGGGGGDTFLFARGDGTLTIHEESAAFGDRNVLRFAAGVAPADVAVSAAGGDVVLAIGGDRVRLVSMLSDPSRGVQVVEFADGTIWDARRIVGQLPASDRLIPAERYYAHSVLARGNGQTSVDVSQRAGVLQLGAGIAASDLLLQANPAGDLTVRLRGSPGDAITFRGALSRGWWGGVSSQLTQFRFADGTTAAVGEPGYGQGQPFAFTYVGTGDGATLVGSGFGSNTFILGSGDDKVVFGDGGQGGQNGNTVLVDRGGGHDTVDTNGGWGTLRFGAGISASDVLLQADDATGDLTVRLRGSAGEAITFRGDLSQQWWGGVRSQLSSIVFADGTTSAVGHPWYGQGQDLTFTWVGTATDTTLVGSGYGANVFEVGPGGDAITFGNGGKGGSGYNTVLFDRGDGRATIAPNGGTGEIRFGAGIGAGDVTFRADDASGDLTIDLGGTGDSLTIKGDLGRTWWGGTTSRVGQITFGDGGVLQLGQQGWWDKSLLTFTWTGTAAGTALVGSNYGDNTFQMAAGNTAVGGQHDNTFHLAPGVSAVGGSGSNTYLYGRGGGAVVITPNGTGTIRLGAGTAASDLVFQADDATGDLTILDGAAGDSVVLKGDLGRAWWGGPTSRVGQITFADGGTLRLGQQGWWDNSQLTFTWTGAVGHTVLTGSGYGSNTFILGPGGDRVTFGDGSRGGSRDNTVVFGKGDGNATIDVNGAWGTLKFEAGIAASDVMLQADDATGDLVVRLRGDADDSITFRGDLSQGWWGGVRSQLKQIAFADGTTMGVGQPEYGQGQPLAFTWVGTATNTALVGSAYGSNTFILGPGGDTVAFAGTQKGGSGVNTVVFHKGDGRATATLNGAKGVLQLGAGIAASDVLLQANQAGDLTVNLRGAPGDSVTFRGALSQQWWGVRSAIDRIVLADGTTMGVGQPDHGQGQPLTLTWVGTADVTTLTGSGWGANVFDFGPGGDKVTAAAGQQNTYIFGRGDGRASVDPNGASGRVSFGAGITPDDVVVSRGEGNNDLVFALGGTGDSLTISGGLLSGSTAVQEISFADGTRWSPADVQSRLPASQVRTDDRLQGTSGADVLDGGGGDDYAGGNGGADTFIFRRGYGRLEIWEDQGWGTSTATLRLGTGIDPGQVAVGGDGYGNVFLTDGVAGDRITLDGQMNLWGGRAVYGVGRVQFADGTIWTRQQLAAMATTGTAGADKLYGSGEIDTFDGKGGDDYVQGNGGADTFVFDPGYGRLEINHDAGWWTDTAATLRLGAGIAPGRIAVTSDQWGNVLLTGGNGDRVQIDGMMNLGYGGYAQYGVAAVQFADGTTWTRRDVTAMATTGKPGADRLYGTSSSDIFDGKGGGDYAQGNGGTDTFVFDRGYGQLEVNEDAGWWKDTTATLRLGAGIAPSQVAVTSDRWGNVILTDGVSGDRVQLDGEMNSGYGGYAQYGVSTVQFADGTSWTRQELVGLATTGTAGADGLYGTGMADVFDGKGGDDYAQGNGGADTFVFNPGYGRLEVNEDAGWWKDTAAMLRFGAGITAGQIGVTSDQWGNVLLTDGVNGDQVQLDGMKNLGYGGHAQYGVAAVQFDDGTSWSAQQLLAMLH